MKTMAWLVCSVVLALGGGCAGTVVEDGSSGGDQGEVPTAPSAPSAPEAAVYPSPPVVVSSPPPASSTTASLPLSSSQGPVGQTLAPPPASCTTVKDCPKALPDTCWDVLCATDDSHWDTQVTGAPKGCYYDPVPVGLECVSQTECAGTCQGKSLGCVVTPSADAACGCSLDSECEWGEICRSGLCRLP